MDDSDSTQSFPDRNRSWRVLGAVVIVAAAVLFTYRLGDRAVVSEELRWAEIAREMRDTGDYWHPTLNGQTYYDKPIGSYWLIVAASHFTGGVNERAARLPSAIFGVLGVGLIISLGRMLYDHRVSVLAGAILATSFGIAFYSRRATADIETVVGVLASLWLYVRFENSPRRGWVVLLWLAMAGTSLTKGLLGFALPLLVISVDSFWQSIVEYRTKRLIISLKDHFRWFLNRWSVIAVPIGIAVYFLPFFMSFQEGSGIGGLEMVWRENVQRFLNPHNHKGPVYLYLGVIFVISAPWSVFLPASLMPLKRTQAIRGDRFARVYFWAVFLFFTVSASRRSYYLLPVLPPVALLIANILLQSRSSLSVIAFRLRQFGWFVFGAGIVACGAGLFIPTSILPAPYNALPPLPYRMLFGFGWIVGITFFAVAAVGKSLRLEWVAVALVIAMIGYVFGIVLPETDGVRTRREFTSEVRSRTDDSHDRVALYHARDIVFDLGRNVPEYLDEAKLAKMAETGQIQWVVARRHYLADLTFPIRIVVEEAVRPWEEADQIRDKMVLVEVLPK